MVANLTDAVKKFFDAVKHELERKRLRIHTQKTSEGRLFLDFVALILCAWISKIIVIIWPGF